MENEHELSDNDEPENEPENKEIIGEIEETEWTQIKEQIAMLHRATTDLADRVIEIEDRIPEPLENSVEATEEKAEDLTQEVTQAEELTLTQPDQSPTTETRNKKKPQTKKILVFKRA